MTVLSIDGIDSVDSIDSADSIEMRPDSVRMQDRAIICDLEPVASLSSLASGNTNDEMVMEWPRCELGRRHTAV